MKRAAGILCALVLLLCLLAGCGITDPAPLNKGETYLDGAWYLDDDSLHVGYNFFPDGGGFLFIGETVVPIRYGVLGERIYIYNDTGLQDFTFGFAESGILIGGVLYQPVEEDMETAASIEALLSNAQAQEQQQPAEESAPFGIQLFLQLITLAAAAAVVVILVRYFSKKRKKQ